MKARPIFLDSPLGVLCLIALLSFSIQAMRLAFTVDIDYFDGYNFLLQSRRLTDPDLSFVSFFSQRPRALVIVITLFDLIYRTLFTSYPSLHIYFALMVVIAIAFICIWIAVISLLVGRATAYVSAIFLLVGQLINHYSFTIMSDNLAGLLWGLSFLFFLKTIRRWDSKERTDLNTGSSIILGIIGALAGLTKNHLFLILPLVLFIVAVCYRKLPPFTSEPWGPWKFIRSWILICVLSFLVSVDILTRVFGYSGEGIPEHLRHIIVQALHSASEPVSPWLYLHGMYDSYGFSFWVLTLATLFTFLFRFKYDNFFQIERWRLLGLVILVGVTLCFTGLTQLTPHREIRYLLPLLPAWFAFLAFPLVRFVQHSPRPLRYIWIVVFSTTLLYPISRSWADIKRYYTEPIYHNERIGLDEAFAFLSNAQKEGSCNRVQACALALVSETPWEFPLDPYYRQYDIDPQYSFYTKLPTRVRPCPHPMNGLLLASQKAETGSCHVLKVSSGKLKVLVPTQMKQRNTMCIEETGGSYCYQVREFMLNIP